jgi:quinol monooxygenase YgiN
MIVEYTRYKIDEKRRSLFEEAYGKAGEALRSSIHCQRYELSRCTEDPNYYTLRIEWDSEDGHLKGFRNSPEFKTFFALIQPYIKDIEEMRHYSVIGVGEKSVTASTSSRP